MPTLVLSLGGQAGLAVTSEEVERTAEAILSGKTDTEPTIGAGTVTVDEHIDRVGNARAYRIDLKKGERISAVLTPAEGLSVSLFDPFGFDTQAADGSPASSDGERSGSRLIAYEATDAGSYTLVITSQMPTRQFHLTYAGDNELLFIPFKDPEDGQRLSPSQPFIGELQFSGDSDTLLLDLQQGKPVIITLRSWFFDAFLRLRLVGTEEDVEADDNSGRGLFGTDALIQFVPQVSGTNEVVASSRGAGQIGSGTGFYRLWVENPLTIESP